MFLCRFLFFFFFSSRRRHTRFDCDGSSDVCSSDLLARAVLLGRPARVRLRRERRLLPAKGASVVSEFWKGRRVLITGASGFLGAWLARLLLERGAEVRGFDLATGVRS